MLTGTSLSISETIFLDAWSSIRYMGMASIMENVSRNIKRL
jgi:hypothetical protein